jgi:hypothetical protein
MTPYEAYCCLMMYIRPKINYPFPCVSLIETQCCHIQAPILEAILPKLNLNRHMPRAVLFVGPRYGGLSITKNYTDLGFGHFQYLVGHINLGDEVGQLLLSLITHTQLQVGSTTPFFQLQYPTYDKWIDHTWITDFWKFTHRAQIFVEIESHWTLELIRHGDIAFMDLALTYQLDIYHLQCINTCWLYLQVVTVSDTVTAKEDKILLSVLDGERDSKWVSDLLWHHIPRPPTAFWSIWQFFLQFFSRGRKLMIPLGPWKWFQYSNKVVWEKVKEEQWKQYIAVSSS